MSNVIPFDRDNEAKNRIKEIEDLLEKNDVGWVKGSVQLGVTYAEYRDCHPSDIAFSVWLTTNGLGRRYNTNDQAALINMGRHPEIMRAVLEETSSRSYQLTWLRYKNRFPNARKPTALIPDMPKSVALAVPEAKPVRAEAMIPTVTSDTPSSDQPILYPLPEKSKLRDAVGTAIADVLISRFKHSRIFIGLLGNDAQPNDRSKLKYLAERCQQPDYPADLFLTQTWSPQLLYPHLPKRFIGMLPTSLSTLHKQHTVLIETERRFMQTPEFGMTDPPLAAYNKAYAIYTALTNARKGHTVDPAAIHRPTFGDDEGKPQVIVRGTKLWPAETGAGYCYDDLRCACGFAADVMNTFDDTRNASLSSRTLKLRHLMSWVDGGYNSTGSTTNGMLKAMRSVIDAYSKNISEEMRNPFPSMIKNDGDAR
jgi:hypothetical protein